MFKNPVIISLFSLLFISIVHSENIIDNELEINHFFKVENLISQWQYKQNIRRINEQLLNNNTKDKTLGGTSVINGHVQDVSASNLVSHDITLYEIIAGEFSFVTSEITDVDGNYSFLNLQTGTYIVLSGSLNDAYLNYRWQSDSPTL